MKPMLAFKFNDHKHKLSWPAHCQPKLDGVRAIYRDGQFYSRDLNQWEPKVVAHLRFEMQEFPRDWVFDGEFYVHSWKLQEINGAIAVTRKEPSARTIYIQYHIFDCYIPSNPKMPFTQRNVELISAFANNSYDKIKRVQTYKVDDIVEFERKYRIFRQDGFEGAMYRKSDAPYGLEENCSNKENRWKCLLKRKEWLDDWFECVGFDYGEGRLEQYVGALHCVTADGKFFKVGSGLTDSQRDQFKRKTPSQVKLQFECYSIDGLPLKPVFLEEK